SVGIVSEWEHGRKEPRHATREKLCELYAITEAELFKEIPPAALPAVNEERDALVTAPVQEGLKEEKTAPPPALKPPPVRKAPPTRKAQAPKPFRKRRRTVLRLRYWIDRKIQKIKKTIYREFLVLILISAVMATICVLNVGGPSRIAFMALVIWIYILYLLLRIGLWARTASKTRKTLSTYVFLAVLLGHLIFINSEIAFFSAYIHKAEDSISTYPSKSAAAAVVKKVLESWEKGDYYNADLYRDGKGIYKSLYNVNDFEIVDSFAISGIPYTEITARIGSTTEEGFPVENLWCFFLRKDADGSWKIVSMRKLRNTDFPD
ncbi:MAG: hypothetical protein ABID83_04650, partial [Candidatus Omnitrophota bacterium]